MCASSPDKVEILDPPSGAVPGGVQDLHFVRGAGTHDHGLGHHASHLSRLQVTHQHCHTVLHLVQRYVFPQATNNRSGGSLSHVHLLHVERVGVWVLLGLDDASNTQVQTGHVHLGILLRSCLFLLLFLPSFFLWLLFLALVFSCRCSSRGGRGSHGFRRTGGLRHTLDTGLC